MENKSLNKPKDFKEVFLKFAPQIKEINPSLNSEIFINQVYHEWVNNEQLRKCSINSILISAKTSAQLGLLVGKIYGQAWIVPYWNNATRQLEAQFQIGYKGMIIMAKRSGYTVYPPQCICKGDKYKIDLSNNKISHELDLEKERGEPLMWYVKCKEESTGNVFYSMLSIKDINKRRDFSLSKIKPEAQKHSPWVNWYEEMCSKTVIKSLIKTITCNDELYKVVHEEEMKELDITPVITEIMDSELIEKSEEKEKEEDKGQKEKEFKDIVDEKEINVIEVQLEESINKEETRKDYGFSNEEEGKKEQDYYDNLKIDIEKSEKLQKMHDFKALKKSFLKSSVKEEE